MANLSSFDLNLLRVLHALLDDPSTTRAADRLGLSQPAVSAALSRLRHALGDDLFFRKGQGLEPTDFAISLRDPLNRVMADVQGLIAAPAAFDPAKAQGSFRISGSDFFGELLMPPLARHLQKVAPGLRLHLVDLVPEHNIAALETYNVDAALLPAPEVPDWIEKEPVFVSSFSVVARHGHPRLARAGLAAGDVIPIDLFCDIGQVVFSTAGSANTMGDTALAKVGRARRVVMTLPSFGSVYRAVAGSDLIAILPSPLAYHVADQVGLTIYRAPVSLPKPSLEMIWHRRHSANPMHLWMRAQIVAHLAPLEETEARTP